MHHPKKKKKKQKTNGSYQIINCIKWHFNSGRTDQPICPHIIYARDSFNPKSERLEFQRPTHQPGIGQFSRVQISKRVMISLQSEERPYKYPLNLSIAHTIAMHSFSTVAYDLGAPVNFLLAYAIGNIVSPCF